MSQGFIHSRLALGMVGITLCLLALAFHLDVLPSQRSTTLAARAALCEAVAISSTPLVARGDFLALEDVLEGLVAREVTLRSAAIRRADGEIYAQAGSHASHWKELPGQGSTESQVRVPIRTGITAWGQIEFCFQPVSPLGSGTTDLGPWLMLFAFMGGGGYTAYRGYLAGSVLPGSSAVDPTGAAINALPHGVLLLDAAERVVLVNHWLAQKLGVRPERLIGRQVSDLAWMLGELDASALPWRQTARNGRSREGQPLTLRDTRGRACPLQATCLPLSNGHGPGNILVALADAVNASATVAQPAGSAG